MKFKKKQSYICELKDPERYILFAAIKVPVQGLLFHLLSAKVAYITTWN